MPSEYAGRLVMALVSGYDRVLAWEAHEDLIDAVEAIIKCKGDDGECRHELRLALRRWRQFEPPPLVDTVATPSD